MSDSLSVYPTGLFKFTFDERMQGTRPSRLRHRGYCRATASVSQELCFRVRMFTYYRM
jgi:hypothetical protein